MKRQWHQTHGQATDQHQCINVSSTAGGAVKHLFVWAVLQLLLAFLAPPRQGATAASRAASRHGRQEGTQAGSRAHLYSGDEWHSRTNTLCRLVSCELSGWPRRCRPHTASWNRCPAAAAAILPAADTVASRATIDGNAHSGASPNANGPLGARGPPRWHPRGGLLAHLGGAVTSLDTLNM